MKIKHIKINKTLPMVINIGSNLSKNTKPPINKASIYDYAQANTEASMFLHPTDEQELLTVVKQCKGKSFTGYDRIDMYVVKKVKLVKIGAGHCSTECVCQNEPARCNFEHFHQPPPISTTSPYAPFNTAMSPKPKPVASAGTADNDTNVILQMISLLEDNRITQKKLEQSCSLRIWSITSTHYIKN